MGLVAGAHRSHAAIAGQRRHLGLGQTLFQGDAVDGLQTAMLGAGNDVGDVIQMVFHGPRRAEPVEGLDHEIGVPEPAIAVVPVAPAVRRLGDRRGHGGDDAAAFLEAAQLQRDGGADHRVLPFEGHRQVAGKLEPVLLGASEELAAGLIERAGQAFVRPEKHGERPLQHERDFVQHVRDRRVGGTAQRQVRRHIADVVAAARACRALGPEGAGRTQAHADARMAGDRRHMADHYRRPEHPVQALETRREVGDLQCRALGVVEGRPQDGGVVQVALFTAGEIFHLDVEEPEIGIRVPPVLAAVEQAAEHGVAVEAGHAGPHHPASAVDEGAERAVADHAELQVAHALCPLTLIPLAPGPRCREPRRRSHRREDAGNTGQEV